MRGDTAIGHVDAHNELRSGILREAERFGVTVDIGGPYNVGDPGHVQEHEKSRKALELLASTAGVKVTLPPVRKLGDHNHAPGDHDLLTQALAVISKADAWNDATGGTITDYTKADKTRWRVHTFTGSENLVVKRAVRPFRVLVVGGGGGGSPGGGDIRDGFGGGGSGGQGVEKSLSLGAQTYPVTVGAGAPHIWPAGGSASLNGGPGSPSSLSTLVTAQGGRGGLRNTPGDGPTITSDISGTSVVYGSPGCSNCCHTGQGRHSEGVDGLGSGGGGQEQGQNTSETFGCQGGSGVVIVSYQIGVSV